MAFKRLTSFLSPGRKPSSDAIQAAKPNYATVLARTKLGRWSEAQDVFSETKRSRLARAKCPSEANCAAEESYNSMYCVLMMKRLE